MKYMANGSFLSKPLMRLTLIATLIFLAAFWVTTAVMYFSKMGLTPQSVVEYYRGSEATYTPPRTFGSMLEVTHGHLPVMAMVALLLTHLFIFSGQSYRVKVWATVAFFAGAFFSEAASWLVRYVHPGFAWLKIAAFLTLEIAMAYVMWGLFSLLIKGKPRKRTTLRSDKLQKPAASSVHNAPHKS
jgi:magnesium-transporting ATPase (P-type)